MIKDMYDLARLKKECTEICEELGVEFTAPVSINGRLTLTLGRVINGIDENGVYNPKSVEFSKQLLETATDSAIYAIIQHEMVHYYITKTTHERHGHDALFKKHCARIGCKNDGYVTSVERQIGKARGKYTVYCSDCGSVLGHYNKFSGHLKNLDNCSCGKCGGHHLYYEQNW